MHKCEIQEGVEGQQSEARIENRKSEVGCLERDLGGERDRQPGKKMKLHGDQIATFHSEVVLKL